jgi:hypothetical protein
MTRSEGAKTSGGIPGAEIFKQFLLVTAVKTGTLS